MSTTTIIGRWIGRRELFWADTPLLARHAPFLAIFAVVIALTVSPLVVVTGPVLIGTSVVLAVGAALAAAVFPWERWPVVWSDVLLVMQFAAIICVELGTEAQSHLLATLAFLPVVALAMKPGWHGVVVGTLGVVAVVVVPPLVEGVESSHLVGPMLLLPLPALAVAIAVHGFTGALRAQSTALELAAQEVTASRDRMLDLIDAAKDQVILAAASDGRIQVFNQGAEHVLGYPRDEAVEQLRTQDLLAGPRPPVTEARVVQLDMLRRDGERRTLRAWVAPQAGLEGDPGGVLLVGTDITDELETLQLQQTFLGMVSHELRSPISSILGFTELLGLEPLDDDQRRYVEVIDRNGRRLLTLVSDLLLSTQVTSGRFEIVRAATDLSAITHASLLAAEPAAEAAQVTLVDDTDGPIPLQADAGRITQVIDNLLSNALKFTPAGGTVTVTTTVVECADGSTAARLSVADTGPGIPPDEASHLTEQFFRASTATARRIPGAGLGLFIVQAIVGAHGGRLDVDSRLGDGTTFTVDLPLP